MRLKCSEKTCFFFVYHCDRSLSAVQPNKLTSSLRPHCFVIWQPHVNLLVFLTSLYVSPVPVEYGCPIVVIFKPRTFIFKLFTFTFKPRKNICKLPWSERNPITIELPASCSDVIVLLKWLPMGLIIRGEAAQ